MRLPCIDGFMVEGSDDVPFSCRNLRRTVSLLLYLGPQWRERLPWTADVTLWLLSAAILLGCALLFGECLDLCIGVCFKLRMLTKFDSDMCVLHCLN